MLQEAAYQAYANQDFQETVNKLTSIINEDAQNPRWLEMRAQVGRMFCVPHLTDCGSCGADAANRLAKPTVSGRTLPAGCLRRCHLICSTTTDVAGAH